jgi:DMSO/TMAO reductase YedYZ heme-binding membrane subunit
VFALWGIVLVEATSLAMKRLPKKVWRGIHFTSYVTFVLTSLHGTFAGTDAANRMYAVTSIIATLALMFAVTYRVLTRRSVRAASAASEPMSVS